MKCRFNDKCDINVNTRRLCSSCRLKKCFAIGMCSKMIRSSHPKKNETSQKKKLISDSISTALVILNNQNQPEQVRIFLFCIYSNSTNDKLLIDHI